MNTRTLGGSTSSITVDGGRPWTGTLRVTEERVDVSTNLPQPDPHWSTVDARGHFHAMSGDGTYPTLRKELEHRDCDGACGGTCEGYDVAVYHCWICEQVVQPGTTPGPHYRTAPGRQDWTVETTVDSLTTGTVSVLIDAGPVRLFGVAAVGKSSASLGQTGISVTLHGMSPLGRIGSEPVERDPAGEVLEKFIADAQVALAKLRSAR